MATQAEIGQAAEASVVALLKRQGWTICAQGTQAPGPADIEAASGEARLIAKVKAAVSPALPEGLSREEARNIKSRAVTIGASAYVVQVTLGQGLERVETAWYRVT